MENIYVLVFSWVVVETTAIKKAADVVYRGSIDLLKTEGEQNEGPHVRGVPLGKGRNDTRE